MRRRGCFIRMRIEIPGQDQGQARSLKVFQFPEQNTDLFFPAFLIIQPMFQVDIGENQFAAGLAVPEMDDRRDPRESAAVIHRKDLGRLGKPDGFVGQRLETFGAVENGRPFSGKIPVPAMSEMPVSGLFHIGDLDRHRFLGTENIILERGQVLEDPVFAVFPVMRSRIAGDPHVERTDNHF